MTKLKPIRPGDVLLEEFLIPFGLNPNDVRARISRWPGKTEAKISRTVDHLKEVVA
jgi:plasmid maintenance system antidote protein VapI